MNETQDKPKKQKKTPRTSARKAKQAFAKKIALRTSPKVRTQAVQDKKDANVRRYNKGFKDAAELNEHRRAVMAHERPRRRLLKP